MAIYWSVDNAPFEAGIIILKYFMVGWLFTLMNGTIWSYYLFLNSLLWLDDHSFEEMNCLKMVIILKSLYGWMMIDLVDEPTHLKIVITCSHFILEGSHSIHQTSFQWWLFIQWDYINASKFISFDVELATFIHQSPSHPFPLWPFSKVIRFWGVSKKSASSHCLHLVFEPPFNP